MAGLFSNKSNESSTSQLSVLETKYNNSISNLLLVVGFSLVNIVLLITNSDTYFLFSAFIPYIAVDYGMYLCGLYPEVYYYDMPETEFFDKSFLAITIVIAAVVLLIYVLCWHFAKKRKIGWLIFSLIFFVIDTVAMLFFTGFSMESIFDIVIHIWVISYLVIGIIIYFKMKKMPEESGPSVEAEPDDYITPDINSNILRRADNEVKARIFIETEAAGQHIVFRRVKRTNELVVNGNVYDEYVALAEMAHTLTAQVNGHNIEAKFDGIVNLFIFVDGQLIAKKTRIY